MPCLEKRGNSILCARQRSEGFMSYSRQPEESLPSFHSGVTVIGGHTARGRVLGSEPGGPAPSPRSQP